MTTPVLRDFVGRLPESVSRVVGYQFGWLDRQGMPVSLKGGKGVRPALAVVSAEAVGGEASAALRAAVAVELVHNFSLLHDDVMDGDVTRRHRPTVWAAFGVPVAILVGDALLALAVEVLASTASPEAGAGVRCLGQTLMDLTGGQAVDVEFETRDRVGRAEYTAMATGKTASLIGCACMLGAMSGGAPPDVVRQMRQFGLRLGLAFQLVDDLLGIWGDPNATGKPAGADLRCRKKTFPVVLAIESDSAEGRRFRDLYRGTGPLSDADVDAATRCLEQLECGARTEIEARRHLDGAMSCLAATRPFASGAADLEVLARSMVHRER